jgi:hypothetical protein
MFGRKCYRVATGIVADFFAFDSLRPGWGAAEMLWREGGVFR